MLHVWLHFKTKNSAIVREKAANMFLSFPFFFFFFITPCIIYVRKPSLILHFLFILVIKLLRPSLSAPAFYHRRHREKLQAHFSDSRSLRDCNVNASGLMSKSTPRLQYSLQLQKVFYNYGYISSHTVIIIIISILIYIVFL